MFRQITLVAALAACGTSATHAADLSKSLAQRVAVLEQLVAAIQADDTATKADLRATKARLQTASEKIAALETTRVKYGDDIKIGYKSKYLVGDSGTHAEIQVTIGGTQTVWTIKK